MNYSKSVLKFPQVEAYTNEKLSKAITTLFSAEAVQEEYFYLSVTSDYSVVALLNVELAHRQQLFYENVYLLILETIHKGITDLWFKIYTNITAIIYHA